MTIAKERVAVVSKEFGELSLAYTTEFTFCWNQKNTGGQH